MKYVLLHKRYFTEKNLRESLYFLNLYFLNPLGAGIFGFGLLFLICVIMKGFSSMMQSGYSFSLGLIDIVISLIGFGLLFLIQLLTNLKKNKVLNV